MNQTASGDDDFLHPVLAAALGSLDVTLESELAQYRCRQTVKRLSPSVVGAARRTETPVPQGSPPLPQDQPTSPISRPTEPPLNTAPREDQASVSPEAETENWAEPAAEPEDYLASSQALLRNLAVEPSAAEPSQKFLTPLGIFSLVLLLASFPVAYWIIQSSEVAAPPQPTQPLPAVPAAGAPAVPDMPAVSPEDQ